MSFWNQNSALSSQIDDLLSQKDVNLKAIMDDPEVIQECKSQNKKLIEYLTRYDVLKELIMVTINEPSEDDDQEEIMRYKYSSIACELLTSEVPPITETLASEQFILSDLFSFLENDVPLNPLLASFFSRIMGVLISKTSEQNWFSYQVTCLQVLEFLKDQENFIKLLVKHIGTSAIMDLILRMYEKIEGADIRKNFSTWLDKGEFLEHLISQLNPESTPEVRSNVCQLLCDLILTRREIVKTAEKPEHDPIAEKIESKEFVKRLLDQMFKQPSCEGCIVGVISVLLTLLNNGKREGCPSWSPKISYEASTIAENTVAAIIPRLAELLDVLHNPPKKAAVKTTVGIFNPPLGATRVEVVRLLAALVATGHDELLKELQRLQLLNVLLDLFFQYPWNNFLHAQVEATIIAAFQSNSLVIHVLSECRLINRLLEAWEQNDAQEEENKPRRGYMGHVIQISNHIEKELENDLLRKELDDIIGSETLTRWKQFADTSLAKVNGDMKSKHKPSQDNENEEDYQMLCTSYNQLKTMSNNFVGIYFDSQNGSTDTFQMNDDESLKPDFSAPQSEAALAEQAELFNLVCAQKLQSLDDDSEPWSGFLQNSSNDQESRTWNEGGSSDEEPGADDDSDEWTSKHNGLPVEQYNPWSADVLCTSSPPDQGWADFEASPFLANFGFDLSSTIATATPGHSEPVPFDLTPTEAQLFPSVNDPLSDWPSNDAVNNSNAALPLSNNPLPSTSNPTDWPYSSVAPETPPSDVETPPADKEDRNTPSSPMIDKKLDKSNDAITSSNENDNSFADSLNDNVNTAQTRNSLDDSSSIDRIDAFEFPSSHNVEMEVAQVVNSDSSAEIVLVSDISKQGDVSECNSSPSSSSDAEAIDCTSTASSNVRALPSETVIKQTDLLNDPSAGDSVEVARQLANLLAEVSVSMDSPMDTSLHRTLNDVKKVNGPSKDEKTDSEQPENTSSFEPPVTDNVELQENVPIVSSSKVAAKEDEVTTPKTPVTAI